VAKLLTLKKRPEFSALKDHGKRISSPYFLLQGMTAPQSTIRWGFIITKKMGNAVVRHRIRRRLKELIRIQAPHSPLLPGDYVIIPRKSVATESFSILQEHMEHALYTMARVLKAC
jgi:ribonuclease P protein component